MQSVYEKLLCMSHLVDLHALAKQNLSWVMLGPLQVTAATAAADHAAPAQETPVHTRCERLVQLC